MSNFFSRSARGSAISLWLGIGIGVVGLVLPLASQVQEQKLENPASAAPQVQAKIEAGSSAQQEPKDQSNQPHEDLDAVLWIQTSAEYEAISRQTFRAARAAVGDALVDAQWTASTEQQEIFKQKTEGSLDQLPPAVVLDVDETVLNNSRYQVGLIESGGEYSRDGWKAYVESQVATPIPGAVDFIKACRTAGVTVIYLSLIHI